MVVSEVFLPGKGAKAEQDYTSHVVRLDQDVFKYLIAINASVFNMVKKVREHLVFSFLHHTMSKFNSLWQSYLRYSMHGGCNI